MAYILREYTTPEGVAVEAGARVHLHPDDRYKTTALGDGLVRVLVVETRQVVRVDSGLVMPECEPALRLWWAEMYPEIVARHSEARDAQLRREFASAEVAAS